MKIKLSAIFVILTTFLILTLILTGSNVLANEVTFKIQEGGVYDGMPLFDGDPDHLEEYVDQYFEYTGLEGPAVYATGTRNIYTLQQGENSGNKIPGALSAADNVQGVSTDFPSMLAMGQSWNKDLVAEIGNVMGLEKMSTLSTKQGVANVHSGVDNPSRTVAFTVVSDLRNNPLSGRFDENYSEDPYLTSTLIDSMASAMSGINDAEKSENGFWTRGVVGSKHFSVYQAQWFRDSASNIAGPRAIYEYQIQAPLKALASGSVSGVMSSFGRTNGIPNIISPYVKYADQVARFGLYTSPDWAADAHLSDETFGNGYDKKYAVDRIHGTTLQVLANSNAGRPMNYYASDVTELVKAVESGLYGVTEEDLIAAARPHVNALVRAGIFNEADENGVVKDYPYLDSSRNKVEKIKDYKTPAHQEVAKKAARESIVLLKNEDNVLPLNKNSKVHVSGIYANARFKTQYSVSQTPPSSEVEDSGFTPLQGILDTVSSKTNVKYDSGNQVVALKSNSTDKFVTAVDGEGDILTADYRADDINDLNKNNLFNVFKWGQGGGYSLQAQSNNYWLTYMGELPPDAPPWASVPLGDIIKNTDKTKLAVDSNDWANDDLFGSSSSLPPTFRDFENEDGSISIAANSYTTDFSATFVTALYGKGRFVTVNEQNELIPAKEVIGSKYGLENPKQSQKFKKITVKDVAEDAADWAKGEAEYALVFVGANVKHSASEGKDRATLRMAESDYKLVEKVAAEFAAEDKKTVVVVETNFPVVMEEIENNENVDAIVYQPYGGQYDGKALAEVLFGEVNPTGRLTATWYQDMDNFDSISKYSIPEGNDLTIKEIDPMYQIDMTNADPIEAELTYLYNNSPVTYEFGYGLSYSTFEYDNFETPENIDREQFTAAVDVTNTGDIETAEVVQLYIKNKTSAYKDAVPNKQLIAYQKVNINPGETETVLFNVDPDSFKLWDVNCGEFIIEAGDYDLMVGSSSEDIKYMQEISVNGLSTAELDPKNEFNVFNHSYDSEELVYYEVAKANTVSGLRDNNLTANYYAAASKSSDAWTVIPKVQFNNLEKVFAKVASKVKNGTISLILDSPENEAFATIPVSTTGKSSYVVNEIPYGARARELEYNEVETEIKKKIDGVHDLYLKFNEPNLRIDSLKFE